MSPFIHIRVRLFVLLLFFLAIVLGVQSFVLLSVERNQYQQQVGVSVADENNISAIDIVSRTHRKHWVIAIAFLAANSLIAAVVLFFRFDGMFIKPLERLHSLAGKYHEDSLADFSEQLPEQRPYRSLRFILSQMLGRIEKDRQQLREKIDQLEILNRELVTNRMQLVRSEKLATVGQLSAGLAHEIGNPLAIVQGYLDLLKEPELSLDERRQFTNICKKELDRVGRLVGELLQFSRSDKIDEKEIILSEFLQECVDLSRMHKSIKACSLQLEMERDLIFISNTDILRQILLNTILNAADALIGRKSREITVSASKICKTEGEEFSLKLTITDNGPGVTESVAEHMFEPFFTTKKAGEGTGLGLFVSRLLTERLGGEITAENLQNNRGFRVCIILPIKGETE